MNKKGLSHVDNVYAGRYINSEDEKLISRDTVKRKSQFRWVW